MEATHGLTHPMGDVSNVRSRDGLEAEFEAVFLSHFPRVVGVLARLVGDRNQAEELGNEVFWRLYKHERALVLSGNVAPWLYRTATRAGIDAIRASTRRSRYEQAVALAR
ncbi:MAG: hypothetical protein M3Y72_19100, partial [Acidobacteriota bacterium]|nr:hypothetical protein [Acidobacteriota bacterium]